MNPVRTSTTLRSQADRQRSAEPSGTVLVHQTDARCGISRVTVLGVPSAGLLAVVGYQEEQPRAVGVITVGSRDGKPRYSVCGVATDFADLDGAARAAAERYSHR